MENNYYNILSRYIPDLKSNKLQQNVNCIFHEESQASLSVNTEKGLYQCFGCGEKGDIYALVMNRERCTFKEAKYKILGDARPTVLSEAEVEEAHKYLLSKKYLQDLLFTHRRWTLDTIVKFKLGWNEKEKRVYIPIYNEQDQLVNIRKYMVVGKVTKQTPKFLGIKGHNENYFFPIKNLATEDEKLKNFIMLCAGEPDTILACQLGFNAGTFTSGEGSFNKGLLPLFKGKDVYICYDKDLAGLKGIKVLGPEIIRFAKDVKIIDLPF